MAREALKKYDDMYYLCAGALVCVVHVHVCVCMYACMCVYVCMCVCMYVCMYVCTGALHLTIVSTLLECRRMGWRNDIPVGAGALVGGGDMMGDTICVGGALLFAIILTSENCFSQDSLIL